MHVLYTIFQPEKIGTDRQQCWLAECSPEKQLQIGRLRYREDRLRSLIALQLLKQAMVAGGETGFDLKQLRFGGKDKPVSPVGGDFSISHSAELVACVVSRKQRVGIDVEQLREINAEQFNRYFSSSELARCSLDRTLFFDLWSQKEAVMKAANSASLGSLRAIELNETAASLRGERWFLFSLDLHPGFRATLATDSAKPSIITEKISLIEEPEEQ